MVKRFKSKNEEIELILSLRFGRYEGNKSLEPCMGYASISRLTGIPCSTIRARCLRFEKSRSCSGHSDSIASSEKDANCSFELQQVHIDYLTSESTLKSWVSRSIQERCVLFHRQFPDKFIKPWRLRFVYKQNLIKQKVINIAKMPIKAKDGRYVPLFDAM